MVNGNVPIKTGAWDPEEDDLLYYWQSKVGNKWSEVAKHIPGRTGQQCAQRWRHKVNPNIRRDKWTAEEDAKLIELVKTFGVGRWAEIARNCDGRTDQQCMGRWRRHLDPNIRRDSWSPEEDNKLRQLHAQFGTSWSRISKCLKGRTSQQCRARWHQINNGRGSKSSCTGGSSTAGSKQRAGGKRGVHAGKRKPSRRRSDFSDSEEEEEELESENEDGEYEPDYEQDCEHASSSPHIHCSDGAAADTAAAARYNPQAIPAVAAAAAAAAAGGGDVYGLDMQLAHAGSQLHHQDWAKILAGQAAVAAAAATAAGQLQRDDLTCGTDQEEDEIANENVADEDSEDEQPAAAAIGSSAHRITAASRASGGKHSGLPPIKQECRNAAAARHRDAGGSIWFSPQRQQHRSPSKVLMAPRQQARAEWQQLQRKTSTSSKASSEINEEEAAGAETLLQMAHLLRRESCEFEPPSLRRSDFITASTPPKRHAVEQPDLHAADELTPSPFKRARSSRGALFTRLGVEGVHNDGSLPDLTRGAAAAIEAAADEGMEPAGGDVSATGAGDSKQPAVAAEQCHPVDEEADPEDYMDAGVDGEEEVEGTGFQDGQDPILGFGLGSYPNGPLPDPPARPSNASSLTGVNAEAAAAAVSSAASVFLSPPPVPRVPGSSGRWKESTCAMVTPRRPTAQQNLMNLLGSPSFDRMAGYASPPSAGRTQPSAATLAALQSPQPSCVHEPFWTPFTGLFKDAMFTRGTSATPDLPSGGKLRSSSVGLFSPGRRSNSASKAMPRRSLLASPAHACRAAVEDSKTAGTQAAGSNTKAAASVGLAESETGPSPAAACGLQSAQQVNHRVVRRLDQHEAWGTPLAAATSAVKAKDAPLGTGFSLFSPVKKQRVPLFNEGNAVNIGVSPAKLEPADLPGCALTIAPLSHDLPSSCESVPGNISSPQEMQSLSSPGINADEGLPHGKSPSGPHSSSRAPTMSWMRPPASHLLSALPRRLLLERSQQRAAQQEQQPSDTKEAQAEGSPMATSPEAGASDDINAAPSDSQAAEEQRQAQDHQQQQQHHEEVVEEAPGVVSSQQGDAPDTPVHLRQATSDNTSCSGTPNTPADRSNLARGAGTSPSDYVTPQQRMRLSRPLAPLHKDCLIAAATRSLASMSAAQDATNYATSATTGPANQGAAGKTGIGGAKGAAAGGPIAASADMSAGQQSGSVPNSADSSKHDGFMDSPLQPCQQLQSPTSQWHQGMVAMLRNLQQTPLQAGATCDVSAGGCDVNVGLQQAGSKVVETGAVRAGSRALRRLQDELERGSEMAAAAVAQQQADINASKVPLSSSMATLPATRTGVGSTPGLLPLFNPAVPSHANQQAQPAAASVRTTTPVGAGRGSSVASVSLAPAVMSCSRGDMFTMQAPVTSSMPSLAEAVAGLPAMAWPVQQRPDGGLVLSAPSAGDVAAAAVLQLTPPPHDLIRSQPAAVNDQDKAACSSAATEQQQHRGVVSAATADAAPALSSMLISQWPSSSRVAVVSLQPVAMFATMMGAAAATPAAGLAAVQPMLAVQQPGKSCSTAVKEQQELASAAGTAQPERYDNSHAVRSRLHALIDGV